MSGREMSQEELLAAFDAQWTSEGFLTREHEELRRVKGRETLGRFFEQQQRAPERPTLIEEKFKCTIGDVAIVGRWDRVDVTGDEAIIIDYKSSDVHDQSVADKRAKSSLQMVLYALAWQALRGRPPLRVELRFLETGLIGTAQFTDDDFEQAKEVLHEAAAGIRARRFAATPEESACRWCAFQAICPSAFPSR